VAIYEFWLQYPNGSWVLKRAWKNSNTGWDTTGYPAGHYNIHVWARSCGRFHELGGDWRAALHPDDAGICATAA
jgi:hypothetical protein